MERTFENYPIFSETPDLIDLDELKEWVLYNDDDFLVIDKPGWVVCHPSKHGPWSSLVGACREWTEIDPLHLVSRLDRETSGLVMLAKNRHSSRIAQMALQERCVRKVYVALLEGELQEAVDVNQPLARDIESPVYVKQTVRRSNSAQKARTIFTPLVARNGFTLTRVEPITGRKHQIRAHAQWLGHAVVGDKVYGPDATLYLEFIERGWTERMGSMLPMRRQALHAIGLVFESPQFAESFFAPLAWDMAQFCEQKMGIKPDELSQHMDALRAWALG